MDDVACDEELKQETGAYRTAFDLQPNYMLMVNRFDMTVSAS